jgi:hypothetical protein
MISKIVDHSTRKDAIVWDESTARIEFYDEGLEVYLRGGIIIPYYVQADFEGKQFVYLPVGADEATTKLFIKALRFYFDSEICKWGYDLIEDAQPLKESLKV